MEQFVIQSRSSLCRKREGGVEKALKQDIIAFYHGDYQGGGNWRVYNPQIQIFAKSETKRPNFGLLHKTKRSKNSERTT